MKRDTELISVSRAAFIMGLTYQQTREMLLNGGLRGRIDERGHLWVERSSAEAFLALRQPVRLP
jgi:hypothetical protein